MSQKISSLTPEQEALLPVYVERWVRIGLDTTPADAGAAQEFADWFYPTMLKKPKVPVALEPSPFAVWKRVISVLETDEAFIKNVMSAVEGASKDDVLQVLREGGSSIFVLPYLLGHFWVNFFAFYEFMFNELGIKPIPENYTSLKAILQFGPIYPLDKCCVISDKPERVSVVNGRLHHEKGPAVRYRDGFSVWALNGVRVDQKLVETPSEQLDPRDIVSYANVQQRREFVRKVGLERIKYSLGARTIDERELTIDGKTLKYKLLEIDIAGTRYRALEMQNASLPEVWHVEFVPTECNTFEQAWNSRVGLTEETIDDERGSDWYLHGDVVIRPEGATRFKRYPTWIA